MDPDLASVLLEARQAAGLSQAELARRAGISASYVSRVEGATWERGGPWPSDSVLRALARALGISSTELVAMLRKARSRHTEARPPGHLARRNGRLPYAVSVGHEEVDRAARRVIERTRSGGTLRSLHVSQTGAEPSYRDALLAAPTNDPGTILYRVRASAEPDAGYGNGAPANARTHFTAPNPLALDVVVGDQEVLVGIPGRRGHAHLRAAIVVDDPDFVSAVREWFDDTIWDPHVEPGPREDRGSAGIGLAGPPAASRVQDAGPGDVPRVAGRPAKAETGTGGGTAARHAALRHPPRIPGAEGPDSVAATSSET